MREPTEEEIKNVIMPLMLSGAKMLDRHCPKCGSPLFEKDGRVFCPVCEYRAKKQMGEVDDVKGILMKKLVEIANSLPGDPEEMEKHLRVMERIIDVLRKYKELEG
ncbi:Sjogren's syndrome/scleroderma autoantigen 1 family protein [Thermococcus waiotapuensis]|uniref:Sjogren's syndrome/scleroderma autoantigen 1 family protein n=1 Tax=Thermococcus waiotapuensis TaxID=90909 RepID=A0AAE4NSU6_9EURY|nr:Sjogren's syndrome/scleroderma autoantigen 1 family protein [Thermococcus waiotapuensis]MDV3103214.1 Sjogren's syndrome/scleroderma autoantigen 1 family protein [Thermococcus waiotapuensis]